MDSPESANTSNGAISGQRVAILVVGGVAGLMITLVGLVLGYAWWSDILSWLEPAGDKKSGGSVLAVIALILGGAALAFLALQAGRADERHNVVLRRVLYGYNAALTGLLVFLNLLVFNCLVSARTAQPLDFTASGIYTLSASSEGILRNLKEPVSFYIILQDFPQRDYGDLDLLANVEQLLANSTQYTDQISPKRLYVLDPNDPRSERELIEMVQRYPAIWQNLGGGMGLPNREGVLIVVNEGERNEDHRFIPASDLFLPPAGRGESARFKGEDAIMTELSFLAEEQKKTIVYFTQGNGELGLDVMDDSPQRQGIGQLKRRMEKRNFEFKALTLKLGESVPADAHLVVVAGPREPLPEHALKALRDYLAKQGKLVVFLDLILDLSGRLIPSGLEELIQERGVFPKNERLLAIREFGRYPSLVFCGMNTRTSNPVAGALAKGRFLLEGARPIDALPARRPDAPVSEPLMDSRGLVVVDTDFRIPPSKLFGILGEREIMKRVTDRPVPLAAVCSDPVFDPGDPHRGMMGPTGQKPRLVVFGGSSLIANRFIEETTPIPNNNFDLVTSLFDWLRERSTGLGIQPKTQNVFAVPTDKGMGRLFFLPAGVMLLAIVGLGTGVWLVRRR